MEVKIMGVCTEVKIMGELSGCIHFSGYSLEDAMDQAGHQHG